MSACWTTYPPSLPLFQRVFAPPPPPTTTPSGRRVAMADKVLEILVAADALGQRMSDEEWGRFSDQLVGKVVSVVDRIPLTYADVARLGQAVGSSKMLEQHKKAIVDKLSAALMAEAGEVGGPTVSGATAKLQNWTTVLEFLTSSIWGAMQRGQYDTMIAFLLKMGLRYPSEPTAKALALAFVCASQGIQNICDSAPQIRLGAIKMFKSLFKAAAARGSMAQRLVLVLPATPEKLKEDHPALYASLYEQEPPSPMPLNHMQFLNILHSTRCRAERGFADIMRPVGPAAYRATYRDQMQAERINLQLFAPPSQRLALGEGGFRPHAAVPLQIEGVPPTPLHRLPIESPEPLKTPPMPESFKTPPKECAPSPPTVAEATAAMCSSVVAKAGCSKTEGLAKKSGDAAGGKAAGRDESARSQTVARIRKRPASATAGGTDRRCMAKLDGPTIRHEASRSQFVARTTTKGPSNSKVFAYGLSRDIKTAERLAKEQVRSWCAEFGVPVPHCAQ